MSRFNSSKGNGHSNNNNNGKNLNLPNVRQERQLSRQPQIQPNRQDQRQVKPSQIFNQPRVQTPTVKLPTPRLQLPGVKLQVPSAPNVPGASKNDISVQGVRRQVTYDEMYGTTHARQNELKDKYDRANLKKKKEKGATVSNTIQRGSSILDQYKNLGRR